MNNKMESALKYQRETLDFVRATLEKQWSMGEKEHDCHLSENDGCVCQRNLFGEVVHNNDCPKFSDMSGATEDIER
jgi:hypothetical protein